MKIEINLAQRIGLFDLVFDLGSLFNRYQRPSYYPGGIYPGGIYPGGGGGGYPGFGGSGGYGSTYPNNGLGTNMLGKWIKN